jgi:hypothetical protein
MSLSGTLYCYRNPLESRGEEDVRQPWYDTTCCPPNLERTFAAIPGYLYSTSPAGVYVNFYHSSTLDWHLENGTGLRLVQQTNYPWQGGITLKIRPAKAATFTLYLRIPGWSSKPNVTLEGKPARGKPKPGEYFAIHREWKGESTVRLQLDVTAQLVTANPLVREDYEKVAVQRGPLLYCLEQVDQEERASIFDVTLSGIAGPTWGFTSEFRPDILGGIVLLKHKGVVTPKPLAEEPLYRTFERMPQTEGTEVDLAFIPYYAWANRLPGPMEVWIPYTSGGQLAAKRTRRAPR